VQEYVHGKITSDESKELYTAVTKLNEKLARNCPNPGAFVVDPYQCYVQTRVIETVARDNSCHCVI
jgi:hypothetical protein